MVMEVSEVSVMVPQVKETLSYWLGSTGKPMAWGTHLLGHVHIYQSTMIKQLS